MFCTKRQARWRASLVGLVTLLWVLPTSAGPRIQTWQTQNGTRVLFVEAQELPILDVRLVFRGGSVRDGERPGLASLTSGMLTQGAGDWNADQIAERLADVGAQLSAGALRDMAWVGARTLTREPALGTTLETLATVVSRPRFPEADLERLRKATLVSLRQDDQDPARVGQKAWYQAIYGDHPYASDPAGTPASVSGLTRQELVDFHRRYYVARNGILTLVGALTRAQAEQVAEQLTRNLPEGQPASPVPPVPPLSDGALERIPFPSAQAHLYTGQPGMSRVDPDYFPLYVGNHILGGNGLVSQLSEEVREKRGLSYSVYSYFQPMQGLGPFLMGLQTKSRQADQARQVLMDTLSRFLDQGPTDKELRDAKLNLTGGFPLRIASNGKILEYLAVIGFYDLPLDYLDTFNDRVNAVTAEQIRDGFRRRLDPGRFATVIVGPSATAEEAGRPPRTQAH